MKLIQKSSSSDGTGEVVIDISNIKKMKKGNTYIIKYKKDCPLKNKRDTYFQATLKNQFTYSFIFENVNYFKNMNNHFKCVLTVPANWLDLFDIYELLPNIPQDVIANEILPYLFAK